MNTIDATNPHPFVTVGDRVSVLSYSPLGDGTARTDWNRPYMLYADALVRNVYSVAGHGSDCVALQIKNRAPEGREHDRFRGVFYVCSCSAHWACAVLDGALW